VEELKSADDFLKTVEDANKTLSVVMHIYDSVRTRTGKNINSKYERLNN